MTAQQNRFVIVAPMFNASKTLSQMLHSIVGQSYKNWKLILIDDCSEMHHIEACKRIIRQFEILGNLFDGQITLIVNKEKRWEVANVLAGISLCESNDVIARVDPDDFLCELDTFRILDLVYKDTDAQFVHTAHRWFSDDQITSINISAKIPDNADPYVHPWVTSHLKTFRKHLIEGINDENFRGEDGEYIKRAGDQAIVLPCLYRAKKNVYLPIVAYAYRCDLSPSTFQTDDAKFQKSEAEFIRARGFVK